MFRLLKKIWTFITTDSSEALDVCRVSQHGFFGGGTYANPTPEQKAVMDAEKKEFLEKMDKIFRDHMNGPNWKGFYDETKPSQKK